MNSLEEQEAFYKMFDEMWGSNQINELDKHGKKFAQLDPSYSLHDELEYLEKTRIIQALEDANGNQTKAAKVLKLGRTCLIAKIKKFNL